MSAFEPCLLTDALLVVPWGWFLCSPLPLRKTFPGHGNEHVLAGYFEQKGARQGDSASGTGCGPWWPGGPAGSVLNQENRVA